MFLGKAMWSRNQHYCFLSHRGLKQHTMLYTQQQQQQKGVCVWVADVCRKRTKCFAGCIKNERQFQFIMLLLFPCNKRTPSNFQFATVVTEKFIIFIIFRDEFLLLSARLCCCCFSIFTVEWDAQT